MIRQNQQTLFQIIDFNNHCSFQQYQNQPHMDFQHYINHHSTRLVDSQANPNKSTLLNQSKPKVIKFVGNMQQNIRDILQQINCHCGKKKEFFNILLVFTNKIQKLRKEREHYKCTLKEYLLTMNKSANDQRKDSINQAVNTEVKAIIQRGTQTYNMDFESNGKQSENKQQQGQMCYSSQTKSRHQYPLQENGSKRRLQSKQKLAVSSKKKQKLYTELIQNINHTNLLEKEKQSDYFSFEPRNHFTTAVKKPLYSNNYSHQCQDKQNLKPIISQFNSQDKRLKPFNYQSNNLKNGFNNKFPFQDFDKNDDEAEQFSLNLSSFEEPEKANDDFMKEVESIMSQTNLLESDSEEETKNPRKVSNPKRKESKIPQIQDKINKLKMLKQSNNFEGLLAGNENKINKMLAQSIEIKKINFLKERKQNLENASQKSLKQSKKSYKTPNPKYSKGKDKQNIKIDSCLKQYNNTLQRLGQIIQNKEHNHHQKSVNFEESLKQFKIFSSCTLKRDPYQQLSDKKSSKHPDIFDNILRKKNSKPILRQPLQERKLNCNF